MQLWEVKLYLCYCLFYVHIVLSPSSSASGVHRGPPGAPGLLEQMNPAVLFLSLVFFGWPTLAGTNTHTQTRVCAVKKKTSEAKLKKCSHTFPHMHNVFALNGLTKVCTHSSLRPALPAAITAPNTASRDDDEWTVTGGVGRMLGSVPFLSGALIRGPAVYDYRPL